MVNGSICSFSLHQLLCDTAENRCRGDVSDYVLMEGRGFGFVTFQDPTHAQSFLEVRDTHLSLGRMLFSHSRCDAVLAQA